MYADHVGSVQIFIDVFWDYFSANKYMYKPRTQVDAYKKLRLSITMLEHLWMIYILGFSLLNKKVIIRRFGFSILIV